MESEHLTTNLQQPQTLVIGLGGVGCKVIALLEDEQPTMPDCLAIHTDGRQLELLSSAHTLHVGEGIVSGNGTGHDMSVGALALENKRDYISDFIMGYDAVILIAGLGGGLGSGGAPVLAELASQRGAIVIGLVTLPFTFEGEDTRWRSERSLLDVKEKADAVVCFPNQRFADHAMENSTLAEAFEGPNVYLMRAIQSFFQLFNEPGLLPLNFADIKSLVRESKGCASLACVEKPVSDDIQTFVDSVLSDPMLDGGGALTRAKAMAVGLICGDQISIKDAHVCFQGLQHVARKDVQFFPGISISHEHPKGMRLFTLVSEHWGNENALSKEQASKVNKENLEQPMFAFGMDERGIFEGIAATVWNGEDLDIPTFMRRNIKLVGQFDR